MAMAAQLIENSHQGFDGIKAALCLGSMKAKSNTASGMPVCLWQNGIGSRSSGKERDAETGLDYFIARYYSGAQGRFLSPDEFKGGPDDALTGAEIAPPGPLPYADITNPQSLNKYTYVLNNPLKYTDPDGHAWDWVIDAIGIGMDIYDLATNPSWKNAGVLAADLVLGPVPIVPSIGGVKAGAKLLGKADDAVDAVRAVEKADDVGDTAKTYQTYTKTNPETGTVYSGRTSGTGTPEQNVARRDSGHQKNKEGYGPAVLDKSSKNSDAIRGREQQNIDRHGRARSDGGTSGNAVRGVSRKNPKAGCYNNAACKEFGDK